MIDKRVASLRDSVGDIPHGASVMIGGFGSSGIPLGLIEALRQQGAGDLTIISNNAGVGEEGIASLLRDGLVKKIVCSFPRSAGSIWFEKRFEEGAVELELVPQGTLSERIRIAGAGIGGFLTPTGYGTKLAEGKETRVIDGKGYVLEMPLNADFALIKAEAADPWGNLVYDTAGRNFNPMMAMAATLSIAEVNHIGQLGELDPERVVTPGIYIDRVVSQEAMHVSA